MSSYVNDQGAEAYAVNRHGPDGAILLDPFFTRHIQDKVGDANVVDIGTGAGPWAIYAAQAGAAAVRGFDNSTPLLEQAGLALAKLPEEIASRIKIGRGTVKQLPEEDESFQVALSLNVGCALPTLPAQDRANSGTLTQHMAEMSRVLAPEGFGIVTAPISLDVPFTTYGDEEEKLEGFKEALAEAKDAYSVRKVLGENDHVLRATIIRRGHTFRIAAPQELYPGKEVLRKIPGLVVPNYAHNGPEYEAAFANAGLNIIEVDMPKLTPEEAEEANLGSQYTKRSPFATFLVQKGF